MRTHSAPAQAVLSAARNDTLGQCQAERKPSRFQRKGEQDFRLGHAARRYVSLINLETLRALEGAVGRPVHPLRFRANLYVDDLPAWGEFDWVGKELAVDDGEVRFEAAARIDRCAATAVDPETGARDLNVPLALRRHFGHIDCGVYLRVTHAGQLEAGQNLSLAAD